MNSKNEVLSYIKGIFISLISIIISFILVNVLNIGDVLTIRDTSIFLIGIIPNILLMKFFFNKPQHEIAKSILFVSAIFVLVILYIYK